MHLVIDGSPGRLVSNTELLEWLTDAPKRLGFTRIQPAQVEDTGEATMGYVLLAESHIAAHFYWRADVAHVDAFTCAVFDVEQFVSMVGELGIVVERKAVLDRGLEYLPRSEP